MGIRFRKSFKLAPGIRMNLSGSGIGWTLGPRGASVGIGSRDTFFNAGIPGTGLSSRMQLTGDGGSSNGRQWAASAAPSEAVSVRFKITVSDDGQLTFADMSGNPVGDRLITRIKREHGGAIQAMIQGACDKINNEVEALGEIHTFTPAPDDRVKYVEVRFEQPRPLPPISKQPGFWEWLFKSRRAALESSNRLAIEKYELAEREWAQAKLAHEENEAKRKRFLEEEIFVDADAMERHLESVLQSIAWPRETSLSLEVNGGRREVRIDVDLPEIEQLPRKVASVPSRGYRLTVKEMTPTQVQKLYMRHVHAIAFRIIGEAFAALPTIEHVVLSAYSQRADKATGSVSDEYLYSVQVARNQWAQMNFKRLADIAVLEALERFDLRREMSKTGVFRPVEPFSVELSES